MQCTSKYVVKIRVRKSVSMYVRYIICVKVRSVNVHVKVDIWIVLQIKIIYYMYAIIVVDNMKHYMCIEVYNQCIYIMYTSVLLNKSIKYVKYVEQILCNMKIEMYCLIRNYCNMDKWIVHILYIYWKFCYDTSLWYMDRYILEIMLWYKYMSKSNVYNC